jgi:hypothetical protein
MKILVPGAAKAQDAAYCGRCRRLSYLDVGFRLHAQETREAADRKSWCVKSGTEKPPCPSASAISSHVRNSASRQSNPDAACSMRPLSGKRVSPSQWFDALTIDVALGENLRLLLRRPGAAPSRFGEHLQPAHRKRQGDRTWRG